MLLGPSCLCIMSGKFHIRAVRVCSSCCGEATGYAVGAELFLSYVWSVCL